MASGHTEPDPGPPASTGAQPAQVRQENRVTAAPPDARTAAPASLFTSLLSEHSGGELPGQDVAGRAFVSDLNLDQIVASVAGDDEQRELITALLYRQVRDMSTLRYRHEVFRDLEDPGLSGAAGRFAGRMRQVRAHLDQLPKMQSSQQRQGWFLDAAAIYSDAVRSLAAELAAGPVASRGLRAFRDYLTGYVASARFTRLAADTADRKRDLARVVYEVRIKGARVEVSRYDGEPDFSAEIEQTFARFQHGAVKDYRVQYRTWPGMDHVGAQIAELVARLFGDEFTALAEYCGRHAGFVDPMVDRFDRELRFYLAYLDYLRPLRAAGLSFCYPDLTGESKEVFAHDTFDLALGAKLAAAGKAVVTNEFALSDAERVIVVSGPNQGGKTTFARTFGQLHHLASTGCPVPGTAARLFACDQILTHFERVEDISNLTGKLEDDLLRIQRTLREATTSSIVIMNEIFTSTTVSDARFLGERVLAKVIELDLLCVYVTFVDALASLGPSVVSMASTIVQENPAERTYKIVRKPADGLAYALALAAKHRVTYQQLKERLTS
jgi:DNA mismatch repair protein MutS